MNFIGSMSIVGVGDFVIASQKLFRYVKALAAFRTPVTTLFEMQDGFTTKELYILNLLHPVVVYKAFGSSAAWANWNGNNKLDRKK
jgi:hypothetical protein